MLRWLEMLGRRVLIPLGALWGALLIPAVLLWGHECHGAIGVLAHSPLYGFQALTACFGIVGIAALRRRLY